MEASISASISPKLVSGLVLAALVVGVLLFVIGVGLLAYAAWEKRKDATPLTPEEEAKRLQKRKWGIALLIIGLIMAAAAGAIWYVRRQDVRMGDLFSSPAIAM